LTFARPRCTMRAMNDADRYKAHAEAKGQPGLPALGWVAEGRVIGYDMARALAILGMFRHGPLEWVMRASAG
jgi:hypothetical protein